MKYEATICLEDNCKRSHGVYKDIVADSDHEAINIAFEHSTGYDKEYPENYVERVKNLTMGREIYYFLD